MKRNFQKITKRKETQERSPWRTIVVASKDACSSPRPHRVIAVQWHDENRPTSSTKNEIRFVFLVQSVGSEPWYWGLNCYLCFFACEDEFFCWVFIACNRTILEWSCIMSFLRLFWHFFVSALPKVGKWLFVFLFQQEILFLIIN